MLRRLIAAILFGAILASGCAAVQNMGTTGPMATVLQRGTNDCAVAVLAMLAGTSYERADAVRKTVKEPLGNGLFAIEMALIAQRLGERVRYVSAQDFNHVHMEGILVVYLPGTITSTHAVYVKGGYVYDPRDAWPVPYVLASTTLWERIAYFLEKVQ